MNTEFITKLSHLYASQVITVEQACLRDIAEQLFTLNQNLIELKKVILLRRKYDDE